MNEEEKQKFKQAIDEALKVLNRGGVILYPTDTVWGIGCDATNSEAVRRIFEIKRRSDSKAMLSLVDAVGRVDYYFSRVPEIAWDLWEVADKPLTLILPRARNVAPELIAEDGTMGMRITSEPVSHTLCARLKRPLVSTSANISGEPTARCFADISDEIKQAVDYIIPLRQNETANPAPSGIIKVGDGGEIKVIR
ncbi:MAG: threonylcarbamoyl-AMP synthase [Bacteroidales bacterium]|nr:threonylcarbamoyl-AMP synthase [Bacteroidales bacterium]